MTGFGTAKVSSGTAELEVTVKSVNGRFLEIRPHIPREYQAFEKKIKDAIKASIGRGTVDLYVQRRPTQKGKSVSVKVDEVLAKDLKGKLVQLDKKLGLKSEITLDLIHRMVPIVSASEDTNVGSDEKQALFSCLEGALEKHSKEASREGEALKKDLTKNLKALEGFVSKISQRRAKANKLLKEKFLSRIGDMGLKTDIDPGRIEQEIAMQIDKSDVNEEISRLEMHVKSFLELMEKPKGAIGKKLDFYTQELLREVNTIGSKSQDVDLTKLVVNAKSCVEKVREQVQNIQ
jgi:uncharacterized protein (TIGR00255 family)